LIPGRLFVYLSFEGLQGGFRVTVYSRPETLNEPKWGKKWGEKGGEKGGEKWGEKLSENQMAIIRGMLDDRKITVAELCKLIGLSQTAVENNIKTLQKLGAVSRIGSARAGHWDVHY